MIKVSKDAEEAFRDALARFYQFKGSIFCGLVDKNCKIGIVLARDDSELYGVFNKNAPKDAREEMLDVVRLRLENTLGEDYPVMLYEYGKWHYFSSLIPPIKTAKSLRGMMVDGAHCRIFVVATGLCGYDYSILRRMGEPTYDKVLSKIDTELQSSEQS